MTAAHTTVNKQPTRHAQPQTMPATKTALTEGVNKNENEREREREREVKRNRVRERRSKRKSDDEMLMNLS